MARAARRMFAQAQGSGEGANTLAVMFICICTCGRSGKQAMGNCCLLDAVVSNDNHLYIHQYGYRMDRRRGSVDRPAARLLPRRVAPTWARRARAAVMRGGAPASAR